MQNVQQQAKKMAIQFIQNEARNGSLTWYNRSLNMDHQRKLCFVHNPKCMGTSLKNWLGLRTDNADHRFPTIMMNKQAWEEYTTIVVVRHPIDRFISSYHFHCKSGYSGGYLQKYPDLKSWDMDTYFETMRVAEPYCLAPQWKYTVHLRSDATIDFLIQMEKAGDQLPQLASFLDVPLTIPSLNRNPGQKEPPPADVHRKLVQYYERDFQLFGYDG